MKRTITTKQIFDELHTSFTSFSSSKGLSNFIFNNIQSPTPFMKEHDFITIEDSVSGNLINFSLGFVNNHQHLEVLFKISDSKEFPKFCTVVVFLLEELITHYKDCYDLLIFSLEELQTVQRKNPFSSFIKELLCSTVLNSIPNTYNSKVLVFNPNNINEFNFYFHLFNLNRDKLMSDYLLLNTYNKKESLSFSYTDDRELIIKTVYNLLINGLIINFTFNINLFILQESYLHIETTIPNNKKVYEDDEEVNPCESYVSFENFSLEKALETHLATHKITHLLKLTTPTIDTVFAYFYYRYADDYVIFLDDVIFENNFMENVMKYLKKQPSSNLFTELQTLGSKLFNPNAEISFLHNDNGALIGAECKVSNETFIFKSFQRDSGSPFEPNYIHLHHFSVV